jgi:hypothetical protein
MSFEKTSTNVLIKVLCEMIIQVLLFCDLVLDSSD